MDWQKHLYRVGSHSESLDTIPTDVHELEGFIGEGRKHIEPWLSAVFQAEHLNLLLGSGFTTAISAIAGVEATGMTKVTFGAAYDAAIDAHAQAGATARPASRRNRHPPGSILRCRRNSSTRHPPAAASPQLTRSPGKSMLSGPPRRLHSQHWPWLPNAGAVGCPK